MTSMRAGQVRPLFLAACAGVLGLALLGVLLMAFLGDSTNGLLLGAGMLFAGAVGGLGLAVVLGVGRGPRFLAKSVAEPGPGRRRMSLALICAFLGAAVGANGSPVWVLPLLKKALPGAADNPLLWIASVAAGVAVGAGAGWAFGSLLGVRRPLYACPHCGEPGISSWEKWRLQPFWRPCKCLLCGGRVNISWLGYYLGNAPSILIIVVPPLLWYLRPDLLPKSDPWFKPALVVWLCLALSSRLLGRLLCFWFVPLVRR